MNGVSQLKIYNQKQIINYYILILAENIYIYISIYLNIFWKLEFLKIISTIT